MTNFKTKKPRRKSKKSNSYEIGMKTGEYEKLKNTILSDEDLGYSEEKRTVLRFVFENDLAKEWCDDNFRTEQDFFNRVWETDAYGEPQDWIREEEMEEFEKWKE